MGLQRPTGLQSKPINEVRTELHSRGISRPPKRPPGHPRINANVSKSPQPYGGRRGQVRASRHEGAMKGLQEKLAKMEAKAVGINKDVEAKEQEVREIIAQWGGVEAEKTWTEKEGRAETELSQAIVNARKIVSGVREEMDNAVSETARVTEEILKGRSEILRLRHISRGLQESLIAAHEERNGQRFLLKETSRAQGEGASSNAQLKKLVMMVGDEIRGVEEAESDVERVVARLKRLLRCAISGGGESMPCRELPMGWGTACQRTPDEERIQNSPRRIHVERTIAIYRRDDADASLIRPNLTFPGINLDWAPYELELLTIDSVKLPEAPVRNMSHVGDARVILGPDGLNRVASEGVYDELRPPCALMATDYDALIAAVELVEAKIQQSAVDADPLIRKSEKTVSVPEVGGLRVSRASLIDRHVVRSLNLGLFEDLLRAIEMRTPQTISGSLFLCTSQQIEGVRNLILGEAAGRCVACGALDLFDSVTEVENQTPRRKRMSLIREEGVDSEKSEKRRITARLASGLGLPGVVDLFKELRSHLLAAGSCDTPLPETIRVITRVSTPETTPHLTPKAPDGDDDFLDVSRFLQRPGGETQEGREIEVCQKRESTRQPEVNYQGWLRLNLDDSLPDELNQSDEFYLLLEGVGGVPLYMCGFTREESDVDAVSMERAIGYRWDRVTTVRMIR